MREGSQEPVGKALLVTGEALVKSWETFARVEGESAN